MNLVSKLQNWSDPTLNSGRFPFFQGWCPVGPSAGSPVLSVNITVGGQAQTVQFNVMNSPDGTTIPSSGFLWLRGVYFDLAKQGTIEQTPVEIYVLNYNTPNELAYRRGKLTYPVGLLALSSSLGDPTIALNIYSALLAATTNPLAQAFVPLLAPNGVGIDILDPAMVKGIQTLVSANILTSTQQTQLENLPLPFFV